MSYLNAFVLGNNVNKNQVLATKLRNFSKYLRYITLVSLLLFLILAAISTGQHYMIVLCYIVLMTCIVTALQSVVLHILSKSFQNKK